MKLLITYVVALTNLYGIAPKDVVLEVYNTQNQKRVTKEDLEKEVEVSAAELAQHFVISMEEYFVDDSLVLFETDIPKLLAEKADKPHYIPEKEELLCYQDHYYFEKTTAYQAFFDYMKDYFHGEEEYAQKVCEQIYDTIHLDGNTSNTFTELQRMGVRLKTEEQVLNIHKLVEEIFYYMRLWQNNGHSLVEIAEIQGEPVENLYSSGVAVQFYKEDEAED